MGERMEELAKITSDPFSLVELARARLVKGKRGRPRIGGTTRVLRVVMPQDAWKHLDAIRFVFREDGVYVGLGSILGLIVSVWLSAVDEHLKDVEDRLAELPELPDDSEYVQDDKEENENSDLSDWDDDPIIDIDY